MQAEIISVGTEIILGQITNTNARYLADQRQRATELTLEAWQHFLTGIKNDDPDELALAETLNKQELAVDLRVDDIIRHTAISRNIPNLP